MSAALLGQLLDQVAQFVAGVEDFFPARALQAFTAPELLAMVRAALTLLLAASGHGACEPCAMCSGCGEEV